LLIGFWFERPAARTRQEGFHHQRLGDFGLHPGILTVWATLGLVNFQALQDKLGATPQAFGTLATVAGLLIFCGAMGKSAQFPCTCGCRTRWEGQRPSGADSCRTMVAAGCLHALPGIFC